MRHGHLVFRQEEGPGLAQRLLLGPLHAGEKQLPVAGGDGLVAGVVQGDGHDVLVDSVLQVVVDHLEVHGEVLAHVVQQGLGRGGRRGH